MSKIVLSLIQAIWTCRTIPGISILAMDPGTLLVSSLQLPSNPEEFLFNFLDRLLGQSALPTLKGTRASIHVTCRLFSPQQVHFSSDSVEGPLVSAKRCRMASILSGLEVDIDAPDKACGRRARILCRSGQMRYSLEFDMLFGSWAGSRSDEIRKGSASGFSNPDVPGSVTFPDSAHTMAEELYTTAGSSHRWIKPGPHDLRGPCPGLNTLANHGYLPRNGSDITGRMVLDAALSLEVYNFPKDIMIPATHVGMMTSDKIDSFSLKDIRLHNAFEHDVSLSRSDFALGDNYHFNETIFETLANSNPGVDYYNGTSAGEVLRQRLEQARATNPHLINTSKEFLLRVLETGFYLAAFGDIATGVAPKKFVNIFFREERLPIEEGWQRPKTLMTFRTFAPVQAEIVANAGWTPGPGAMQPSFVVLLTRNMTVWFHSKLPNGHCGLEYEYTDPEWTGDMVFETRTRFQLDEDDDYTSWGPEHCNQSTG
ncbi:Peroxidase, family 2-domain-containing protein [Mycena floridula]|nr:Peroxidase, family 2-domain-containing protein [Mycena floridula]